MSFQPHIVTIGGGSGAPVILRSLVSARFRNIAAIVAATDSGGKTGHLRSDERDRVIAISDLLRSLLALIPSETSSLPHIQAFTPILAFTDGRRRNAGYNLYYSLLEMYQNDFEKVQKHLEALLRLKFAGKAIPVTMDSCQLLFTTKSGRQFTGEHELDRLSMSKDTVATIQLDHPTTATSPAREAIKKAKYIIYTPGSIYGSIIANFLPDGITTALKESSAKRILITNLVTDRNQTHHYDLRHYHRLLKRHTGLSSPFHIALIPHLSRQQFESRHPQVVQSYALEHSHFMDFSRADLSWAKQQGIEVIKKDIFSITPTLNRLRHDPDKLAPILTEILL